MLPPRSIVLMGVSGCGKSTVGRALAAQIDAKFFDADDFHPPENVEKMREGIPLEDGDRMPWLRRLRDEVLANSAESGHGGALRRSGCVLACSALKKTYRNLLTSEGAGSIGWVLLQGDRKVLEKRLSERSGHYMPAGLLDSQLATLEMPDEAEGALTLDFALPVDILCDEIIKKFGLPVSPE